ncbi:hypothetical protein PVK06_020545 [Gossypium arboreum]|uniref:Uncharacterized protein n=1 Tax=Gossypium arboreum TaxID=29729 RepID=A0ABR0PMM7_GOSAR|nr:hypothetical protein PVK06_020545 [Gossypium arboreum]
MIMSMPIGLILMKQKEVRDNQVQETNVGHKTEDCFTLKNTIEEAMQNGELVGFVNQCVSQHGQSLRSYTKENGVERECIEEVEPTIRFREPPYRGSRAATTGAEFAAEEIRWAVARFGQLE